MGASDRLYYHGCCVVLWCSIYNPLGPCLCGLSDAVFFVKTAGTNPVSHLLIFQGRQQIQFKTQTFPNSFFDTDIDIVRYRYSDIFHHQLV